MKKLFYLAAVVALAFGYVKFSSQKQEVVSQPVVKSQGQKVPVASSQAIGEATQTEVAKEESKKETVALNKPEAASSDKTSFLQTTNEAIEVYLDEAQKRLQLVAETQRNVLDEKQESTIAAFLRVKGEAFGSLDGAKDLLLAKITKGKDSVRSIQRENIHVRLPSGNTLYLTIAATQNQGEKYMEMRVMEGNDSSYPGLRNIPNEHKRNPSEEIIASYLEQGEVIFHELAYDVSTNESKGTFIYRNGELKSVDIYADSQNLACDNDANYEQKDCVTVNI